MRPLFHDLRVSPHVFTEQSLAIAGSAPNAVWSEHMPWFEPLYRERMEIRDGKLVMPDRPGLGFTFDPEAVERYRIR